MNVRLIDIDSRIPNLALMQISAWHKEQGDTVGFDVNDPDRVYISCIFKKNAANARGVATMFPGAEAVLGGSGLNHDWLPEPMRKGKPDYDLYPSTYSLGFTTRGCVRACGFCIVREKEGKFRRWQHVSEFADERFGTVAFLDNNPFADKAWFFEQTDWLLAHKKKVDYIGGLDVRLLDVEIAERLKALRWAANLRFAFDNIADEPAVLRGLQILKKAGFDLRHNIQFFVLAGYPEATPAAFDDALYRCRRLKELGTNPFVMKYVSTPQLNALARWANRKDTFWTVDFKDYTRKKRPAKAPAAEPALAC